MHPFLGNHGATYQSAQRSNTSFSTTSHTGGVAHTYNATPTQLVASANADVIGINLRVNTATSNAATNSGTLIELMVGAAAAEQTIIGPILMGYRGVGCAISLPIFIPAGSRIAVRHKSARASLAIAYTLDLYHGLNRDYSGLPQRWVAYGQVDSASDSRGTLVTAGSTNAWGSWTALTTSTTYAHDLWVPMVDGGTVTVASAHSYRSQFAIASTADAATMVTNGTVWEGPMWAMSTAELMTETVQATSGCWVMGDGNLRTGGIIYAPRASGAAVSVRMMCNNVPVAASSGAAILAAI